MIIKNISDSDLFDIKLLSNELTPPGHELEPLDACLCPAGPRRVDRRVEDVGFCDEYDLKCVSNGVYELVHIKENGGWQCDIILPSSEIGPCQP